MYANATGGQWEGTDEQISGKWENLHLSEPHSHQKAELLPALDPTLDWCVVRHSTVITVSDVIGI